MARLKWLIQNASQTLISSRPNPTKKLEENPVPLPEEWLPFPPTPVLLFFFAENCQLQ